MPKVTPKMMDAMRPRSANVLMECVPNGRGDVIRKTVKEADSGRVIEQIHVDYHYPPQYALTTHVAKSVRTSEGVFQGVKGEISNLSNGTIAFSGTTIENGQKVKVRYIFSSQEKFDKGCPLEKRTWDMDGKMLGIIKFD